MKTIKLIYLYLAIIVIAGITYSAEPEKEQRSELETYLWLERGAMFDTNVTNEEIHELIAKGLQHDEPEIVRCSVGAMAMFMGMSRTWIERGVTPALDRQLQDIPNLYDTLIEMWDVGWKEAGGVMPEPTPPDSVEHWENGTGSITPSPVLIFLPHLLASLFPEDDKVYEIIWDAMPVPVGGYRGGFPNGDGGLKDTNNPLPLLSALYVGKFNNPRDQEFRKDILLNKEAIKKFSALAARSLGDFRSDEGFEALVSVLLEEEHRKYGAPHLQVVEAMIKYEEKAAPYLLKMSSRVKRTEPFDATERDLQIALKERLVHFKEKYVDEAELPVR